MSSPAELETRDLSWAPAEVPGTVASSRRKAGTWALERPHDFDANDHWYRTTFEASDGAVQRALRFEGLATLADVFVDGAHVLSTENMFQSHEVDLSALPPGSHSLHLRFRSLAAHLRVKRPRPRWKTKLVAEQQLRWVRTTLLGRMPGWSPKVAPVGPYRAITLDELTSPVVERAELHARIDGARGLVRARFELGGTVDAATLVVGDETVSLQVERDSDRTVVSGELRLAEVARWWPHTHGAQPRYPARLDLRADGEVVSIDLGKVAFRDVALDTSEGQFRLLINGVRIFCRGACWTSPDIVSLGKPDDYRPLVLLARDGGMNMLRVGGTMIIEDDAFYDACDELGVLVWQDFPFANMDYPAADETFARTVRDEALAIVQRLETHPCLAMFCGGSEVHQQAAMLGLGASAWASAIFDSILPDAVRGTGVPYVPSSPSGGSLPFHNDEGCAHYYGVGAYLRPLTDARLAEVRFASECLAFANVPNQTTIDTLLADGASPVHHPRWKERVPRDHGAGWDFEDVRDHYLKELYGVDPMRLRYADMDRYLALSRVLTGEIMASVFSEWRRARSTCGGGIIWFFQDLWPGAGWGVVDADGSPKAAWFIARRALGERSLLLSDEGLNGLRAHVVNDNENELHGVLRAALYRDGRTLVASAETPVVAPGRGATIVSIDAILEGFRDSTYAYHFGPPGHDLVVVTLRGDDGRVLAESFHLPLGLSSHLGGGPLVRAVATKRDDGSFDLRLSSDGFARLVHLDVPGFLPDDDYVSVAPGGERTIVLRPVSPGSVPRGSVLALNASASVRIELAAP